MAQITIGKIPETNFEQYDYLLDYPHWYQSVNSDFTTPGLTLRDSLICKTTWNYNQFPTLQLTYPRDGIHAQKLKENTYIMADINSKFVHQLFKIVHVQPETSQLVIDANHIASTLNDATVPGSIQIVSGSAQDLMNQVLNTMQPAKDFTFDSAVQRVSNINVEKGQQAGAILIDPDQEGDVPVQSVLGLFGGELEFDNFEIHHSLKAGSSTGIIVDYGKNIESFQQDRNIENMWTGAVFVATYTPGQAIATEDNTDWTNWDSDYSSVATVYMAGGSVNVYDSPVEGQRLIDTLNNGDKVFLGTPVHDGDFTPDGKFQINTVNGDDWYPIKGGGWINANWISFDKSGDYLVNNITGDGVVQAGNVFDDDGAGSRVSMSGTAVVAYKAGGSIRVFYSPEIGPDHYPTGQTYKNGAVVHYDMVERNQNGDLWYRIGDHQWLFGPHLSLTEDGSYKSYDNTGYGYIKDGAVKYKWDAKNHKMVPTTTTVNTHGSSKQPYRWVGKGKNRHKVPNKSYWKEKKKKVKVTAHKGRATIDKTIVQGGKTYHHTKYGWIASGSIDYHKNGSVKPQSWDQILQQKLKDHSKVEIYDTPDSRNASNWSIPSGASSANGDFTIGGHEAKGADGKTYVEVTYKGHTGWIPEDNLTNSTLHSPEDDLDSDSDYDGSYNASVDESQKEVTVQIGPLYADGFGIDPNIDKVNTVDLSGNFKHDDQDLSGQQPDGSFVATQADIDQLTQLGQNYLKEYRYGHVDVSTTIDYAEMSGINADWTQLSLYDSVYVRFKPYDIQETAEVYGTVYDCLNHHYSQIQLGQPPEDYVHLMQKAIEDKSNEKFERTNRKIKKTYGLTDAIEKALKLEGNQRLEAEMEIAKKIGIVSDRTGNLEVSQKKYEQALQNYSYEMQEAKSWIMSGGSAVLQFIDASGQQTYINPVEIRASNSEGSLVFNNHGLGFFSPYGNTRTAIRSDGTINAEEIDAGVIRALNVQSLVVNSSIVARVGGYEMTVGAYNDQASDHNVDSSRGVTVATQNYTSILGSGVLNIWDAYGQHAEIHPSQIGITDMNDNWMTLDAGSRNITVNGMEGLSYFLKTKDNDPSIQSWVRHHWKGKNSQWDFL